MLLNRTYNLALFSNPTKLDTARYTYNNHLRYVNLFAGKLFFNNNKSISTKNLGQLANQAQHKAKGIISALRASEKETGNKTNVPVSKRVGCPARIEISTNSFDYWITVENQFEKKKRIALPVKSHTKLNKSLRDGWVLNSTCEFFKDKNGKFYARLFVQREVSKSICDGKFLGCDVGLTHGVSRSDGYLGISGKNILDKTKEKNRERYRQNHRRSFPKSSFKQQLDIEARRAVNVSLRSGLSIAVESPKVLANLNSKLQWARSYFANRVHVLGQESGVSVWEVNPAYTSQTCSKCGYCDKLSRDGVSFICVKCGHKTHADINGARNISLKGTVSFLAMVAKKTIRNR